MSPNAQVSEHLFCNRQASLQSGSTSLSNDGGLDYLEQILGEPIEASPLSAHAEDTPAPKEPLAQEPSPKLEGSEAISAMMESRKVREEAHALGVATSGSNDCLLNPTKLYEMFTDETSRRMMLSQLNPDQVKEMAYAFQAQLMNLLPPQQSEGGVKPTVVNKVAGAAAATAASGSSGWRPGAPGYAYRGNAAAAHYRRAIESASTSPTETVIEPPSAKPMGSVETTIRKAPKHSGDSDFWNLRLEFMEALDLEFARINYASHDSAESLIRFEKERACEIEAARREALGDEYNCDDQKYIQLACMLVPEFDYTTIARVMYKHDGINLMPLNAPDAYAGLYSRRPPMPPFWLDYLYRCKLLLAISEKYPIIWAGTVRLRPHLANELKEMGPVVKTLPDLTKCSGPNDSDEEEELQLSMRCSTQFLASAPGRLIGDVAALKGICWNEPSNRNSQRPKNKTGQEPPPTSAGKATVREHQEDVLNAKYESLCRSTVIYNSAEATALKARAHIERTEANIMRLRNEELTARGHVATSTEGLKKAQAATHRSKVSLEKAQERESKAEGTLDANRKRLLEMKNALDCQRSELKKAQEDSIRADADLGRIDDECKIKTSDIIAYYQTQKGLSKEAAESEHRRYLSKPAKFARSKGHPAKRRDNEKYDDGESRGFPPNKVTFAYKTPRRRHRERYRMTSGAKDFVNKNITLSTPTCASYHRVLHEPGRPLRFTIHPPDQVCLPVRKTGANLTIGGGGVVVVVKPTLKPARIATAPPGLLAPSSIPTANVPIFVRDLRGSSHSLLVCLESSVCDLKDIIASKLGVPPLAQRLVFGGKNLEDGYPLYKYGITRDSNVSLLGRLLGGMPIMTKIYTTGLPRLTQETQTTEDYIMWSIDFKNFCRNGGIHGYTIGPLPGAATPDQITEGLRYVTEAVEDKSLKSLVGSHNSGPEAYAWLEQEYLQGLAKQPALSNILDAMCLKPKENFIAFKARFNKIYMQMDPVPNENVLCTKFGSAIQRKTGTLYDDCITAASSAVPDLDDFEHFSSLLTRLCTQKRSRHEAEGKPSSQSQLDALSTQMAKITSMMEAHNQTTQPRSNGGGRGAPRQDGKPSRREGRGKGKGGSGSSEARECFNCGKKHAGKCTKPKAVCDFVLPDGEKCGKGHLRKFCYYEDPERCRDPKVKELVKKKLAQMRTAGSSGHYMHTEEIFVTEMVTEADDEWEEMGSPSPPPSPPHQDIDWPAWQTAEQSADPTDNETMNGDTPEATLPYVNWYAVLHGPDEWVGVYANPSYALHDAWDAAGVYVVRSFGTGPDARIQALAAVAATRRSNSANGDPFDKETGPIMAAAGTDAPDNTSEGQPLASAPRSPGAPPSELSEVITPSAPERPTTAPSIQRELTPIELFVSDSSQVLNNDANSHAMPGTTPEGNPQAEQALDNGGLPDNREIDKPLYMDVHCTTTTKAQWPVLRDNTVGVIDVSLTESVTGVNHDYMVVDTGATAHLCNNAKCIVDKSLHSPAQICVRTGNSKSYAESVGPVTFIVNDQKGNSVAITRNAVYVPTFRVSLYSTVEDWNDHKTVAEFDDRKRLVLASSTVVPFTCEGNQYRLYYKAPGTTVDVCLTQAELWHQRLGHAPYSIVQMLPKTTANFKLELSTAEAQRFQKECEQCPLARQKAKPYTRSDGERLITRFGERVHMDLAGPLEISNPDHFKYASVFVDAYTLHYGAYCLRHKSEQVDIHKRYCADMAHYGGMSIEHFHSDNGGEFCSEEYNALIRANGARKTTTVPYSPNQNALAEGAFWKLFCVTRALLNQAGLPHNLWPHAYITAAYILNRTPRIRKRASDTDHSQQVITSYELLNGRQPDIGFIRTFGCVAHALLDKHNRSGKLGDVALTAIYLGPARYQRGYHLWCPGTNKFFVARSVRFYEERLYKDSGQLPKEISAGTHTDHLRPDDDSDNSDDDPPRPAQRRRRRGQEPCRTPGCTLPIFHLGPCTNQDTSGAGLPSANLRNRAPPRAGVADANAPAPAPDAEPDGALPVEPDAAPPEPVHTNWCVVGDLPAGIATADHYDGIDIPSPTMSEYSMAAHAARTEKLVKMEDGTYQAIKIPRNYNELETLSDKEKWKEAMEREIESHSKAGTWALVPASQVPAGRKIVGSTWAFDVKRNADGSIARYKARLCAQGFSQLEGWDYNITYSSTVRLETFRALLAVAAMQSLHLSGADIVTAYLNGVLEETIYMRQPAGYIQTGSNGAPLVCRLIKSIYGLKQSGACWEVRLKAELLKMGFVNCEADPCLYALRRDKNVIYLTSYVDDLILASSCPKLREHVMQGLRKVFSITDTGPLTWVLGTAIHQDMVARTVSIDQSMYIEDMMQTFLPEEVKHPKKCRSMPCNDSILNLTDGLPESEHNPLYRKGVGKLMWLVVVSRFDLAYTTSMLGRFNNCGGAPHMEALYQAIRYAYATRNVKLQYGPNRLAELFKSISDYSKLPSGLASDDIMLGYTDASQGGAKPMAGYVLVKFGGPLAWSGYRLTMTTLSSCEAEYVAATRATTMILPMRAVLQFMGVNVTAPTVLFCDNSAAVQLSENNTSSKRLKHIHTRIAYLREVVKEGDIQLHHINTSAMVADIFTKPLPAAQFHLLRRLVMP